MDKKGRCHKGKVVSDKMDKTIVLKVDRLKKHPKYRKHYRVSKKYLVADPKNEYKTGDQLIIQETRPLSKRKNWTVLKKI